jgi:hypothetical protein
MNSGKFQAATDKILRHDLQNAVFNAVRKTGAVITLMMPKSGS